MIINPEDTLVLRGYDYKKIKQSLKLMVAGGRTFPLAKSDGSIRAVLGNDEETIPFPMPVKIEDAMGRDVYCIDLRKAGKREYTIDEVTRTFEPVPVSDANFLVHYALAYKLWTTDVNQFLSIYDDAAKVYAMWISMKVTKRLVLSPEDQNELLIHFAYFFYTRRLGKLGNNVVTDMDLNTITNKIVNLFGFQVPEVQTVLDLHQKKIPENIKTFCAHIADMSDTPKLRNFNLLLLNTMLAGSWFGGSNPREMIATAVEYPPLFMTMIYRGINERSFRSTDIVQLVQRLLNSGKQKQYSLMFADRLSKVAKS